MTSDEGFELVEVTQPEPDSDPASEPIQDAQAESLPEPLAEPEQKSNDIGPPGSLDLLRLALADVEINIETIDIAIARACQSVLAGSRDIDEQEATREAIGILFIYAVEDIGQDHADYLAICSAISATTGPTMRAHFGRPEGCCVYL